MLKLLMLKLLIVFLFLSQCERESYNFFVVFLSGMSHKKSKLLCCTYFALREQQQQDIHVIDSFRFVRSISSSTSFVRVVSMCLDFSFSVFLGSFRL